MLLSSTNLPVLEILVAIIFLPKVNLFGVPNFSFQIPAMTVYPLICLFLFEGLLSWMFFVHWYLQVLQSDL